MGYDLEKNATVETIEEVPEDYRHFYEESEGKYTLSSDERLQGAIKLVTGQAKALTASRGEADTLRKRAVDLSPLSSYGSTPKEISEAFIAKMEEIQNAAGKDKIAKIKESMEKAAQQKIEPYVAKIGSLEGQLKELLVGNTAAKAVAEAKGSARLLMPHIERQVECVTEQEDGREVYKVYVLDEQGQRRFSGTRAGEYMNIGELVEEMKKDKDFGRMFDSTAPQGGGSPTTGAGRTPSTGSKLSSVDKISVGLSKGQHKKR
jgi:hypothetical protein